MTGIRILGLVALLCFAATPTLAQVPADLQKTMDERDHAISNIDVATWWVLDVWVRQGNTWRVAAVQTTTAKK